MRELPGISDPAWAIVREAIGLGIEVIPIPGAVCTAYRPRFFLPAVWYYSPRALCSEGFLPIKKGRRALHCTNRCVKTAALIIYESPFRIKTAVRRTNRLLAAQNRRVALAREITKPFTKNFVRGTIPEVSGPSGTTLPGIRERRVRSIYS